MTTVCPQWIETELDINLIYRNMSVIWAWFQFQLRPRSEIPRSSLGVDHIHELTVQIKIIIILSANCTALVTANNINTMTVKHHSARHISLDPDFSCFMALAPHFQQLLMHSTKAWELGLQGKFPPQNPHLEFQEKCIMLSKKYVPQSSAPNPIYSGT